MSKAFYDYTRQLFSPKYETFHEDHSNGQWSCHINLDIDHYAQDVAQEIANKKDNAVIDRMLEQPAIRKMLHERGWYYIGNEDGND